MELKEGMYVRTKYGIAKIIQTNFKDENEEDVLIVDKELEFGYAGCNDEHLCNINDIIKEPSYNIIDLIEPMDLMYIDISPDDCDGIVVPRIAETLNELEKWKERITNGNCVLKGIVTREQLENNIYRIGD